MLPLILAIVVFVTVVLVVFSFGAAAVTPTSMLGARLRALGGQQTQRLQEKPALRERFEQALDPFSKAIPLSPADVSRTRGWLIQAGLRDASHINYYFGARLLKERAAPSRIIGALCIVAGVIGLAFADAG